MRKLLLLLIALLTGVGGAWADGLKVSTTVGSNAEYQYKIFCRADNTFYLGNTTNATNSGTDYGLFAFYEADAEDGYTNGYYIYSIFEGKWVTYEALSSYNDGQDKISLSSEKPSVPWNITEDDSDSKYYDIRAFKTDEGKSVAMVSWNWYYGASYNTSNTMGFYAYNDTYSGWGIVLAGGSGTAVTDRKVVALYNVPTDNNEYALYDNSVKVYNATTGQTPQYFVLRHNGIDTYGEALYNLPKAEGDGKYLGYQTLAAPAESFMFMNTSSGFYSNYTYTSGTAAASPYYNMFRKVSGDKPYEGWVAECNDGQVNRYTNPYNTLNTPLNAVGSWNARWAVKELEGYAAWQVVSTGTVTYTGSNILSGATTTQSNNGFFVLSATPAASDFTASIIDNCYSDITIDSDRKLIKVTYTNYSTDYYTYLSDLNNAPVGLGYPSAAARITFRAAITTFDNSSKTSADFSTLSTAYNTFLADVDVPRIGKVYTIQNYVSSSSTLSYLKNVSGTFTQGTAASESPLENLWIVRRSGNYIVFQSAADMSKYLTYSGTCLDETGAAWQLSGGTNYPYISMYNSSLGGGRYVASDGNTQFGTKSGNYYAQSKTQATNWSTDFKFTESTEYALYTVVFSSVPDGSSPSVTYNATAYSHGQDFIAPTSLALADLTVTDIAGFTKTVVINGDGIYVSYATCEMELNNTYADTWNYDASPWKVLSDIPSGITTIRPYYQAVKQITVGTSQSATVGVKFTYSSGDYRIDIAGVDLIDAETGEVVSSDYHDGYAGDAISNNEYTLRNVAPGDYILRYISYGQQTNSAGNIALYVAPGNGFYRIKGCSGNYITSNLAGNSASLNGTANANNIIYYDDNTYLIFYGSGLGMDHTCYVATVGNPLNSYTFLKGSQTGKYSLVSNGRTVHNNNDGEYCYDSDTYLNRNGSAVTSGSYNTDWGVEEVTTLPVSISAAGYATLWSPVALTIPTGVTAYTATDNGTYLTLTPIEGTTIPKETGVILKGDEGSYDFAIATDVDAISSALTGSAATITKPAGAYYLGKGDSGVGFYPADDSAITTLAGFKAYLPAAASAKGFIGFDFGNTTGIENVDADLHVNKAIYNLAGQRLSKLQKGVNIVDGMKVLVK
ncbi:MAG: hypothetical protein IJ700_05745 [Bacteroidaceae bacterium]|nr:hypothetical protein [Bacteroidaceae bacterium]